MPDVFLSYARGIASVCVLAHALESDGWSVWWDRKLVAGEAFDETIERQLAAADSVVVLWSEHSIRSEWVKNEAAAASSATSSCGAPRRCEAAAGISAPTCADLTHWTGDPTDGEFGAHRGHRRKDGTSDATTAHPSRRTHAAYSPTVSDRDADHRQRRRLRHVDVDQQWGLG